MSIDISPSSQTRFERYLVNVYGEAVCRELLPRILDLCAKHATTGEAELANKWSQDDVLVITYGDSIRREGEMPLQTLHRFLKQHLETVVTGVHILPFFPYSSDDGFSVIDYLAVNPELGGWSDIRTIAGDFTLMADLVINHISAESLWFGQFLNNRAPGKDYFHVLPADTDTASVVRPRSTPLLVPFDCAGETKHVWATFSADQIDLNFANPDVLIAFLEIIAFYLENGTRWIRLDAVGFLWKELDTPCIHLPQTHELIKLIRLFAELVEPNAVIITETNVPNRENLSYFGNMNEAHMIYNFSLPPLMLDALLRGDARHLQSWMMSMPPAPYGCAYFNFSASHDGIGLRPAEGLLAEEELAAMITTVQRFGGEISMRQKEGREAPYEMNVTYWDALKGTHAGPDGLQLERFLCSQIITMSLEGVPALYLHSFLGTENDREGYGRTGRKRSINRHKWDEEALNRCLEDPASHHARVLERLSELLRIRRAQPAFHPNATQYTLHLGSDVFAFWRQSARRDQSIFVICNVPDRDILLGLSGLNLVVTDPWCDLISGLRLEDFREAILLKPYQCLWLTNSDKRGAISEER